MEKMPAEQISSDDAETDDDADYPRYEAASSTPEMSKSVRRAFIGLARETMEEVERFYEGFALARGFAIKRSYNNRTAYGEITIRKWSCTRAGRKQIDNTRRTTTGSKYQPRPTKRCGCPSFLRVSRHAKTGCWIVTDFYDCHNHAMTPIPQQRFISQNRIVTAEHIKEALLLRSAGIGISHIYLYFAALAEGVENLDFTLKDLYNGLARDGKRLRTSGDSDATIDYMKSQQLRDPNFCFKFKCDDEKSLSHVLWIDGESQRDYACFGDVLIIDATYKTNAYGMPLVILAGVSNHHITIPFAFALLHDENTSSYTWVLNQFLEIMSNDRAPISVVTDGDQAMARSIKAVFNKANHRLCGWHIMENGKKHVRSEGFLNDLSNCLYRDMTEDEFESEWERMTVRHNLSVNEWASDIYTKRHMWANAFLRGSFFGQVRTTQRVEGLNARVKSGARGSMRICELVTYLDLLVQKTRTNQTYAEYKSDTQEEAAPVVHRRLHQHASSFYTHASMSVISEQLMLSGGVVMHPPMNEDGRYIIRESESNVEWQVNYTKDTSSFFCECKLLQTVGFPCRHIFMVMKQERVFQLPEGLIMKRWTKSARDIQLKTAPVGDIPTSKETRYFGMLGPINEAVYEAAEDNDASEWIRKGISNVIASVQQQRSKAKSYRHARDPKKSTKCMKKKKKRTRCKNTFSQHASRSNVHTTDAVPDPSRLATNVPNMHDFNESMDFEPFQWTSQATQTQIPNNYFDWAILCTVWGDITSNN